MEQENEFIPNSSITNIESQLVLVKHWHSDIQFFKDEIKFLNKLLDRYFIWLTDDELVNTASILKRSLKGLEMDCLVLESSISQHLHQLEKLYQNNVAKLGKEEIQMHINLEANTASLVKAFKSIKKEIFDLTETVMKLEDTYRYVSTS